MKKVGGKNESLSLKAYEKMVINLPHIFYLLDSKGKIILCNKNTEKITGYTHQEVSQMNAFDFVQKKDYYVLLKLIKKTLNGSTTSVILPLKTKDNNKVLTSFSGGKITLDGKNYIEGVGVDVSEVSLLEEELNKINISTNILFNNVSEGLAYTDVRGRILKVNDAFLKISGQKRKEVENSNFFRFAKFWNPKDFIVMTKAFYSLARGRRVPPYVVGAKMANGKWIKVKVTNNLIKDNGKVIGTATSIVDITNDYENNKKLQEEKERFSRIVKNFQGIVFEIDKNGTFTLSEGKGLKSLGFKSGEAVGMSALKMYKDIPDVIKGIKDAWKGISTRKEILVPGINGELYFDIFFSPQKNVEGNVYSCIGMAVDVTMRNEILEELKGKKELLSKIESISKIGGWSWDIVTDEVEWTDGIYRMFDVNVKSKIDYKKYLSFIYPNDKKLHLDAIKQAFAGEKDYAVTYRVRTKNKIIWTENKAELIRDENGKPIKMIGFTTDITEVKLTRDELAKNQALYQSLVESSPECIKLFDSKGLLLFINQGGKDEHYLKTQKDIDNFDAIKVTAKADQSKIKNAFAKALKGEVVSVEVAHVKELANREYCRETFVPVYNEYGVIDRVYGVSVDLTSQNQYKNNLQQINNNFNNILENAPSPVIVHTNGKIVYANKASVQTLGAKSNKELLGKNILDFIAKESKVLAVSRINNVLKEKISMGLASETFMSVNKTKINVQVSTSYVPYDEKDSVQMIFNDVSENLKYLNKIEEQNKDLEKINQLLIGREMKMIELKDQINNLKNDKKN